MLALEDWAEIRRLYQAENMPIKAIVRHLGIARNMARSDGLPEYERKSTGSTVVAFEPRTRELLQAYPTLPATMIAEQVG